MADKWYEVMVERPIVVTMRLKAANKKDARSVALEVAGRDPDYAMCDFVYGSENEQVMADWIVLPEADKVISVEVDTDQVD